MKISIAFLLFFLAVSPSSFAQNISLQTENKSGFVREPFDQTELKEVFSFIENDYIIQVKNHGVKRVRFYTARYGTQRQAMTIRKVDRFGKLIKENKLGNGRKRFGPLPAETIRFGDKLLLFFARYDGKDSMKISVAEIDKENITLQREKVLFTYPQHNIGLFGLAKYLDRNMIIRLSPDGTKLLLIVQAQGELDYFTCLIDQELQVKREKVTTLPVAGGERVVDAFVDNKGNAVLHLAEIVGRYYLSALSETYRPVSKLLFQKADNSERFLRFDTIGNGLMPRNIRFEKSKDQLRTYIFGDYRGATGIDGVWYAEADLDNQIIRPSQRFAYTDDLKKTAAGSGYDFNSWSVIGSRLELVEFEDGDIAIAGYPIHRGTGISTGMKNNIVNTLSYGAGPMMVARIDRAAQQCRFSILPRSIDNPSVGNGIFVPYREKLIIFYNDLTIHFISDSLKNHDAKPTKNDYKNLSLGYVILNKDGSVASKRLLVNRETMNADLSTNEVVKMAQNKLFFPSRFYYKKRNYYQSVTVTIE